LATSATADVAFSHVPERGTIYEIGCIPIVNAGSNAFTAAFDRRLLPNDDTGRVDGLNAAGDATLTTVASPVVGTAIRRFVDVPVDKHDEIVVEITEAGAALSTAIFYYKIKYGGQLAVEAGEGDSQ
jgi:hypothetical protein